MNELPLIECIGINDNLKEIQFTTHNKLIPVFSLCQNSFASCPYSINIKNLINRKISDIELSAINSNPLSLDYSIIHIKQFHKKKI